MPSARQGSIAQPAWGPRGRHPGHAIVPVSSRVWYRRWEQLPGASLLDACGIQGSILLPSCALPPPGGRPRSCAAPASCARRPHRRASSSRAYTRFLSASPLLGAGRVRRWAVASVRWPCQLEQGASTGTCILDGVRGVPDGPEDGPRRDRRVQDGSLRERGAHSLVCVDWNGSCAPLGPVGEHVVKDLGHPCAAEARSVCEKYEWQG